MKKTILFFTIFLLAFIKMANSQIATIQTLDGTYGNMAVEVSLSNFTGANSVGAISMNIGFDTNVVSFVGITHELITSGIIANRVGSEIMVSYYINPAIPVNGIAFKLNFVYTGGNTNLTFRQGTEIAAGLGAVIQTTYLDGAIHQPPTTANGIIASQPGVWVGLNELPISFAGFPVALAEEEVGAINLNISYDTTKLDFVGIDGLVGAVANASSGVIHIAWSNSTPINLNTTNLRLQFNYLGGSSAINFIGTNIISNLNGIQIPVSLTNGQISQGASVSKVIIDTVNGLLSGITEVPVMFSAFSQSQGSFTMHISYNTGVLNFIGTSGLSGLNSNADNGIISLAWSNSLGEMISDFKLLFSYIGGECNLEFIGQNQITDVTSGIIPVTYTNGLITQVYTPLNINVGIVDLTPGSSTVNVPIIVSGTSSMVHSATMYLNFDQTKLTFLGLENAPTSVIANQDMATKTIIITWADAISSIPLVSDKFLDLKFAFNGGSSNCDVPIYFTTFNSSLSSISNSIGGAVLANWGNGNVNFKLLNLKLFLEGLYNGGGTMREAQNEFESQWSAGVADKIVVELHSSDDYAIIPYTSPLIELSTLGDASLRIPCNYNDSYFITIKHRNSIETTTSLPISFAGCTISYDFTTSSSQAYGDNMFDIGDGIFVIYCGDFTSPATPYPMTPIQDGVVDDNDYYDSFYSYLNGDLGYLPQDINGDGIIDITDIYMIYANYMGGVSVIVP